MMIYTESLHIFTSDELRRCSQDLKTDFALPGTASFRAVICIKPHNVSDRRWPVSEMLRVRRNRDRERQSADLKNSRRLQGWEVCLWSCGVRVSIGWWREEQLLLLERKVEKRKRQWKSKGSKKSAVAVPSIPHPLSPVDFSKKVWFSINSKLYEREKWKVKRENKKVKRYFYIWKVL